MIRPKAPDQPLNGPYGEIVLPTAVSTVGRGKETTFSRVDALLIHPNIVSMKFSGSISSSCNFHVCSWKTRVITHTATRGHLLVKTEHWSCWIGVFFLGGQSPDLNTLITREAQTGANIHYMPHLPLAVTKWDSIICATSVTSLTCAWRTNCCRLTEVS